MLSTDQATLAPGLQKIDDATYHALPYVSKHALDVLANRTPMHLRYQREHPETPTDAMKFGTAFHTYLLEPDAFESRHPVIGQCVRMKKDGKRCTNDGKFFVEEQWLCGVHAPEGSSECDTAITASQFEQIKHMADAVRRNRAASSVLEAEGHNEAAILWRRRVLGDGWEHETNCKMKVDLLRPSWEMVADLKTCETASLAEFERSIATFSYHRQGAFYQDGCRTIDLDIKHFVFICVEKTAPYGVAVYRLLDDAITLGREENERLITTYAACERNNYWWGYDNEFKDVSLPAWAFRQRANALQI
jgi:hypothetical protein